MRVSTTTTTNIFCSAKWYQNETKKLFYNEQVVIIRASRLEEL